jgi:chromosome segregation ATPase
MIEHLGQQLAALVEELRTVGDPEAAEAQIESVASEAAEQVAGANARATRAEQAQRRAEAEKAEADAAAEEATRTSEELAQELSGLQEELDAAHAQAKELTEELRQAHASAANERELAQAESVGLRADLDGIRVQLTLAEQERDAAAERAGTEERTRIDAERRTGVAESRAEAETARADREESAVEETRGQLAGVRADLEAAREAVADMRSTVATLTAEREAARADVERERIHGEQRVQDLHDTYSRQIEQLRAELTQAKRRPGNAAHEPAASNSRNYYRGPSRGNLVDADRLAQGFQGSPQRGVAVFEDVHGAGSTEFPGRCDHPDREVVVRDFQFHRPLEKVHDGRVEPAAGEELGTPDSRCRRQ